jgi:hypothetical protein
MQGFAYAEGDRPVDNRNVFTSRLTLGFVAWDHGIDSLRASAMFGLKYHAPYKFSCTDGIWDFKDINHGEYTSDCIKNPDVYQMNLDYHVDVLRECMAFPTHKVDFGTLLTDSPLRDRLLQRIEIWNEWIVRDPEDPEWIVPVMA